MSKTIIVIGNVTGGDTGIKPGDPDASYKRRLLVTETDAPIHDELIQVGTIYGEPIVSGVTVVMGKSNTGKTQLMRYLQKSIGGEMIRFGEPYPNSVQNPQVAVDAMVAFMDGPDKLLLVDSLKYFVYKGGSTKGKGGVSVELFQDLTAISAVAAQLGKAIVVVLNIATDDQETIDIYTEAAKTSCTGAVITRLEKDPLYHYRTELDRFSVTIPAYTAPVKTVDAERVDSYVAASMEVDDDHGALGSMMSAIRTALD
jgi:hypothetical protein